MAATTGTLLRLVIIGKTGVGKSHVGNIIVGEEVFESKASAKSVTGSCEKAKAMKGRGIEVVDTPGILDTERKAEDVAKEILHCIFVSSPGPHAFLLVIQVGRFTKEEQKAVRALKKIFGPKVADYMIVVFNRADELGKQTIQDYMKEGTDELCKVVNECGGRCVPFYKDLGNREQVAELIGKVDELTVVNGGKHFSNEVYEASIREGKFFMTRWLKDMTARVRSMFRELGDWRCTCS